LFSFGCKLEAEVGCSIFDLLCRQIRINESYLNDRVQTIFLDNRAVDDVRKEIVTEGSVIALSAAMPGLVGAVMRKGSILSGLRSRSDVQSEVSAVKKNHRGLVTLKLFNLVASELGKDFLEKEILVTGQDFENFLKWKEAQLRSVCRKIVIDGKEHGINDCFSANWQEGAVYLKVNSG